MPALAGPQSASAVGEAAPSAVGEAAPPALGEAAPSSPSSNTARPDGQRRAASNMLARASSTYSDFIIPALTDVLATTCASRPSISVLEIGPGPETVVGRLPHRIRRNIGTYAAYEPNPVYAAQLRHYVRPPPDHARESPFPNPRTSFDLRALPFTAEPAREGGEAGSNAAEVDGRFDVVIFCHSMYGRSPKRRYIEQALKSLAQDGLVIVFHQDDALSFDGLVAHHVATFPHGTPRISNNHEASTHCASFVAGSALENATTWHATSRDAGQHSSADSSNLASSCPETMIVFNQHADTLAELTALVPRRSIENPEARRRRPAAVVRPTDVLQVQQCVQWALRCGHKLAVLDSRDGANCMVDHLVSLDMSALDYIDLAAPLDPPDPESNPCRYGGTVVVAGAGCTAQQIVSRAMSANVTVPLRARPSGGPGLWLQGGIGHLSRQRGLTCDAIVGAVLVRVDTGAVVYVGSVPDTASVRPPGAVRAEDEDEILWAIKGAGTSVGIVVTVVFRAHQAPTFLTKTWSLPLSDRLQAHTKLKQLGRFAHGLARNISLDMHLYSEQERLTLGVTLFETCAESVITRGTLTPSVGFLQPILGPEITSAVANGVELFDTETYVSGMHGGHGGGKTSSFERCVFVNGAERTEIVHALSAAMDNRPSRLCCIHLLHGGGAIADVKREATALGCRDWDYACFVTGVWERGEDGTLAARAAVDWVYRVVKSLVPVSSGVDGTNLGPDPRDAHLARHAFGSNRPRLARLKHSLDPACMLASACPLPKPPTQPKLILLVTGDICAGKDYCAEIWAQYLESNNLKARVVSISDATKREYATFAGADVDRLLNERAYKELHRRELTTFFQDQVRQRPWLPEERFLQVLDDHPGLDVLLVTGMRDEAPVSTFSPLVPSSRVLEVRVEARDTTRAGRGRTQHHERDRQATAHAAASTISRPSLIFHNDQPGSACAESFASRHLLCFFHRDLARLYSMVRTVADFPPHSGTNFHHILDIVQQPGGLRLCTDVLSSQSAGTWGSVGAVVAAESGGYPFGAAVALLLTTPLLLIRKGPGKLPPPVAETEKRPSYISACAPPPSAPHARARRSDAPPAEVLQLNPHRLPARGRVLVVDDVLSTAETLCATLDLLATHAGIAPDRIHVAVVAEFPAHGGRERLRRRGWGAVAVQSAMVFDGR